MAGRTSVDLPVLDEWEHERGRLCIFALPNHLAGQTIFVRDPSDVGLDELDDVRLNEGTEYLYVLDFPQNAGPFRTDHPEMFVADTARGDRGRLRTGLFTGLAEVQFYAEERWIGKTSFEVQSTKLSYLTDYPWMLRDIADICAELSMDRFAPTVGRFSVDDRGDAKTLYQRFAFLQGVLEGDEFRLAMSQILAAPHVTWEEIEEDTWQARGVRPSSRVTQSLALPGPRAALGRTLFENIDTVPKRMGVIRSRASIDNVPNRFVKWVVQEWLSLFLHIYSVLDAANGTRAFERRGKRELTKAIRTLEMVLDDDLFRDVGDLMVFPEANQVLQKREGYRYLYRVHLQFETAARLYWPGLDPIYHAGQRNVAQLYEYWVYLQIGRIVARLCGQTFDPTHLIEKAADELTLRLRAREETMVRGTTKRFGRVLRLECWFNKGFGGSKQNGEGSWTRPLRPDCSLRVEVVSGEARAQVTWIHFDAKYRIERIEEAFGDEETDDNDRTRFRREDLLKMHAYKDAIRRSAGAYIIYPGTDDDKPFRQYHELLPGLGAFALRPANSGNAAGSETLTHFIDDVLGHLALQTTQYARARYWTEKSYADPAARGASRAAPIVERPPADVLVLLGYVKSAEHRAWIQRTKLYNVRADPERDGAVGMDGPELGAAVLVLYGPDRENVDMYEIVDEPRIMSFERLSALKYPDPRGNVYLCFGLECLSSEGRWTSLQRADVEDIRAKKNPMAREGAPVVVTWLDLCARRRIL